MSYNTIMVRGGQEAYFNARTENPNALGYRLEDGSPLPNLWIGVRRLDELSTAVNGIVYNRGTDTFEFYYHSGDFDDPGVFHLESRVKFNSGEQLAMTYLCDCSEAPTTKGTTFSLNYQYKGIENGWGLHFRDTYAIKFSDDSYRWLEPFAERVAREMRKAVTTGNANKTGVEPYLAK